MAVQVKQEFKEIVLSARQDDFFRKNMYANFGEVGIAVKELVGEYQKATNSSKKMQTIEDMQNFVDSFGEFSAAQRSAGKHVTLMSELSAAVDRRSLMDVSSVRATRHQPPHGLRHKACAIERTPCRR